MAGQVNLYITLCWLLIRILSRMIYSRETVLLRDCSGNKMFLELCFVEAPCNNICLVVCPSVALGFCVDTNVGWSELVSRLMRLLSTPTSGIYCSGIKLLILVQQ